MGSPEEPATDNAAMPASLKHRVHEHLSPDVVGSFAEAVTIAFIMGLIVLNVAAMMLETVASIAASYGPWFRAFEVFSVAVFSIEYLARVWSCTADPRFADGIRGRLRYMVTPLAIIDLLAVVPFYLPFAGDLRFLRVTRLFRIFLVFKMARYSESMRTLGRVFRNKAQELVVAVFLLTILLVVAASGMYLVEHEAQPDAFTSIPSTFWWAIITLTTVGYGDVVPVTGFGKFLGALIALGGILLLAVPTGILSSGFVEEMSARRDEAREERRDAQHAEELRTIREASRGAASAGTGADVCPHCGEPLTGGGAAIGVPGD